MLLAVSNLKKAYGTDVVLDGASLRLDRGEKAALVGRNGSGKTTLLRLLTGEEEPDAGSVQLRKGAKLGYLRQIAPVQATRSVLEEAEEARRHALDLRRRLDELEARLEAGATEEEREEYAALHEHFLEAEGYAAERDVRTVLLRMGFEEDELDKPAGKLSGGETTRLALARLILEEPDLLILDEPTNHLDLEATEWLEGWLRRYPGAVLLVSHDRAFLEGFGDRYFELREGRIEAYPGPLDKYLGLREEAMRRQADLAKKQEREIAKLDEYVRRFMGGERTAQARGRLKMKNRLLAAKTEAPREGRKMGASLQAQKRSGDLVVEARRLDVGFVEGGTETRLVRELDWTVRRGEKWGVVGQNGAGKSSLIRTLLGRQAALGGEARLGANVEAGYFAQDAGEFDPDDSPLEVIVDVCGFKPPEARDLLGRYLFSGEDVFRPVRTFSGGERNKLALAALTGLNPNLLVLDEPTNHLDMDSREALAGVLREYNGTLLLVSHDRWLLGAVTNRTLDVRRDGVREFPGSYAEYRRRAEMAQAKPSRTSSTDRKPNAGLTPRELSKEIQRLAKQVEEREKAVAHAEAALREIEAQLASPSPGDDLHAQTLRHAELEADLAAKLESWEQDAHRLEELRAMQRACGSVESVP